MQQSNLSMKHLDPATAMASMFMTPMMGLRHPHHNGNHPQQPAASSSGKFGEQRSASMGSSGSKMSSSSGDSSGCVATSSSVTQQPQGGTHVQSSTKIWQPPGAGIYEKQQKGKAQQQEVKTPTSGGNKSSEVYNITNLKYTPNTSPQQSQNKKSPKQEPSPSNNLGPLLPDGARARYLTPSESDKLYSFGVPDNSAPKASPSNQVIDDEAPTDLTVKKKRVEEKPPVVVAEKVVSPKQEKNCRVEEGVLSHFSQQPQNLQVCFLFWLINKIIA